MQYGTVNLPARSPPDQNGKVQIQKKNQSRKSKQRECMCLELKGNGNYIDRIKQAD